MNKTGILFNKAEVYQALNKKFGKRVKAIDPNGEIGFVVWNLHKGSKYCALSLDLYGISWDLNIRGSELFESAYDKYIKDMFKRGRAKQHWRLLGGKTYLCVDIEKTHVDNWVNFLIDLVGDIRNLKEIKLEDLF